MGRRTRAATSSTSRAPRLVTPGAVQLFDGPRAVDRVAWGSGQPNAVSLAAGDFASDTVAPGTTIGRPPGATIAFQPTSWVSYGPSQATPGAANPVPPAAVLLPMDGAILDAPAILEWYPVIGATSYRVQIAGDAAFASPVVDSTVTEPRLATASLAPGLYVWHVQAIGADGATASFSEPSGFELVAATAQVELARYGGAPAASGEAELVDAGKQLAVPWLGQHKDSTMLLLEEPHEHDPMAWDTIHRPASQFDPADQKNCALAMVAMVNHFYGGDLTEDRIGYEVLKGRQPGPEQDLMYGIGLDIEQTNAAFAFALGGPVTFVPEYATFDALWADVTAAIDAGRPLAAAGPKHGYVIKGYAMRNGHRVMTVNDPARGTYPIDLDAGQGDPTSVSTWLLPDAPVGRHQEPGVTTDSDGDGVVDFDETERFHTNPNDPDGDGDKVHDKQDIAAGIFDPTYGYAFSPQADGPGRDFDADGIPTERDADSDAGGCLDGDEDMDLDGHRNGKETWNFDTSDDVCGDLVGTITWTLSSTLDGETAHSSSTDQVTLNVRFDEEGTEWVDAGSAYTWTGSSRLDDNPGNDDPQNGYCNEIHKTTTTTGGGPFAGSLASTINVDVDRAGKRVSVFSWVAGLLEGHNEIGTSESNGGATSVCVLKPSDYSQGGGTTIDSQAEWGQVPRCINTDESVDGTISADGKTVTFSCTNTVTSNPQEGYTAVDTMTVSGQLTFSAR